MSETPTKIWIQRIWQKVKTFFVTKDVLTFSLFVLLSTSFWFMNALNIGRETKVYIPIQYTGIPANVEITTPLPQKLAIHLKDEGKNLFAYSRRKINPITIDLSHDYAANGEFKIESKTIERDLSYVLRPTSTLLDVEPDSIVIRYTRLTEKKLPIRMMGNISTAPQYILKQATQLMPDSVLVFCPESTANELTEICTQPVTIENFKDSVCLEVALEPIESARYSVNKVYVYAQAEMFTEKSFNKAIKPVNFPDSLNIRTFPSNVTISFNVGISHFNEINPEDIAVVVDYADLKKSIHANMIPVKALYDIPEIFNFRIKPDEIEFILETK